MFFLLPAALAVVPPSALPSALNFRPDAVTITVPARSAVTIGGVTTRCTVEWQDDGGGCWFEAEPDEPLAIHGRGSVTLSSFDDRRQVSLDCTEAGCITTLRTHGDWEPHDAWLLPDGRGELAELQALIDSSPGSLVADGRLARLWAHASAEAEATLATCEGCGTAPFDAGLALDQSWTVTRVERGMWDTAGFAATLQGEEGWTGALECYNFYGDCDMQVAGCELVVRRGETQVLRYTDQNGARLLTVADVTVGDDLGGGRIRGGVAAVGW